MSYWCNKCSKSQRYSSATMAELWTPDFCGATHRQLCLNSTWKISRWKKLGRALWVEGTPHVRAWWIHRMNQWEWRWLGRCDGRRGWQGRQRPGGHTAPWGWGVSSIYRWGHWGARWREGHPQVYESAAELRAWVPSSMLSLLCWAVSQDRWMVTLPQGPFPGAWIDYVGFSGPDHLVGCLTSFSWCPLDLDSERNPVPGTWETLSHWRHDAHFSFGPRRLNNS